VRVISPDLAAFMESGVSVLVGTRDARLVSECQRALGVSVEPDGLHFVVYVPRAIGERIVADARANGRIAVCFARVEDHQSIQLKGHVAEIREARESERERIDRYRNAFADVLAVIGMPRALTLRMAHWPCWAIRVQADSSFVQTPGPGAGRRLAGAES
jgi:hypothetical protein